MRNEPREPSVLSPQSSVPRVAHLVRAVFPQHGYGGMERSATALTRQLLRNGLDVTLFTRPWPPGAEPPADAPGGGHLRVVPIPYSALPLRPNSIAARLTNYPLFVERMGRATARLVAQGGATVIHAHGLCAWGVRQRGRRRGPEGRIVPLIMNPHGLEDFKVRDPLKRLAYAPFRAMYRAGAQAADRVIATDAGARDEISRLLGVAPERVVVLPNALDLDEVLGPVSAGRQAALRARWNLAPDCVVGLSVGRLEANKGFSHLLRALAALPADVPSWHWLIVGAGQDRAALVGLAGALGLADRVVFTGAVGDADLQNLYALATLFVHPSLYEGSSLVTLEALMQSPWHEARLLALVILVAQYRRGDELKREAIYRLYLNLTNRINNWDLDRLVDSGEDAEALWSGGLQAAVRRAEARRSTSEERE